LRQIRTISCPSFLASYEKVMGDPEGFCRAVALFAESQTLTPGWMLL
jgi:hypothetical protein